MSTLVGKPITHNGLGLMRLRMPGALIPDEESFPILKAALAQGITVWNGADFYGTPYDNSLHLLNRYFTKYPEDAEKVVICIKSGIADFKTARMDCSAEALRKEGEKCIKILDGKKKLDIFGPARIDPAVPVEDTVAGLAELVKEGKIGGIQLSEASGATIHRAAKVHKIEMVEVELSLWSPEVLTNGVAKACAEEGIALVAYSPLASGMLTGTVKSLDDIPPTDHRRAREFPRYLPDVFDKNLERSRQVAKLAERKGCSPAVLALSWIKKQSDLPGMPFIVPIAGARSISRVEENCKEVALTAEDLAEIDALLKNFPITGGRYPVGPLADLLEN